MAEEAERMTLVEALREIAMEPDIVRAREIAREALADYDQEQEER